MPGPATLALSRCGWPHQQLGILKFIQPRIAQTRQQNQGCGARDSHATPDPSGQLSAQGRWHPATSDFCSSRPASDPGLLLWPGSGLTFHCLARDAFGEQGTARVINLRSGPPPRGRARHSSLLGHGLRTPRPRREASQELPHSPKRGNCLIHSVPAPGVSGLTDHRQLGRGSGPKALLLE